MKDKYFKTIMQALPELAALLISEITGKNYDYVITNMFFLNNEYISYNMKRKISDIVIALDNEFIVFEMNNYYYDGLFERNDRQIPKEIRTRRRNGKRNRKGL